MSALSWLGDERVAIGCLPTPVTLAELSTQRVSHIVNCRSVLQTRLTGELALERALLGAQRVWCAPMWDHGGPQRPQLWASAAVFAADALAATADARVLIHCQQGRRRSVMVAYAVLRLRGHAPAAAMDLIARHRVEAVLVPAYLDSVERWLATTRR